MTLLDNALEEFKANIGAPEDGAKYGEDVLDDYRAKRDDNHGLITLRLDWELADDMQDVGDSKILDLMIAQMSVDVEDLLENGDSQKSTDPLIKAMDGRIKRGKELVDVKIVAAEIRKQPYPRKESTEYTVFISLYTEWN